MVDIQPQTTQPISDDQELAKVLAGVSQQADNDLSFEETLVTPPATTESVPSDLPTPTPSAPIGYNPPTDSTPQQSPDVPPVVEPTTPSIPTPPSGDLEGIKKDALNELRPLVDKLQLDPEEKFDTYLLLLRSTDDRALIAPAHAAARAIADESRRAQALLDIIKEIDFLSSPQQ